MNMQTEINFTLAPNPLDSEINHFRTRAGKAPQAFQLRAFRDVKLRIERGDRRIILQAPAGAGKTFLAAMLIYEALQQGRRVLFVAHRRELLHQCVNHLKDYDLEPGIIAPNEPFWPLAYVQVASKDCLASRMLRRKVIELKELKLIIVDECHRSLAPQFKKIITQLLNENPSAVLIGLTATPARNDNRGLRDMYDTLVVAATYRELIDVGRLVPARVFAPSYPDMRGVSQSQWDQEAARRMDKPKLIGDIWSHWEVHASHLQTVIFASSREHGRHLCYEFRSHGIATEYLDGETPIDERDDILAGLASGRVQVVSNVDVLSQGWDCPPVGCIVLAAPSRSIVAYRQRTGRVLRACLGKTEGLVMDHSGATIMLGILPDEDIDWPLTESREAQVQVRERAYAKSGDMRVCRQCYCTFFGTVCPHCGYRRVTRARNIAVRHGLLREIRRKEKPIFVKEEAYHTWQKVLAICANRGGTFAKAAMIYRNMIGHYPSRALPYVPVNWCDRKRQVADVLPWFVDHRIPLDDKTQLWRLRELARSAMERLILAKVRRSKVTRTEAARAGYAWLAQQLKIQAGDCRPFSLTKEQCRMTLKLCDPYLKRLEQAR
jgi:superfamily II DNA or RNA helicase